MDKVQYWIDIADYDFDTALVMLDSKRFLYVGFMCHQVIEKMLKAYWSKVLQEPPLKSHTLTRLAEKTGLITHMTEVQLKFIDLLEPLNIQARYPDYKDRLLQYLNYENCKSIVDRTNQLREWIKAQL